MPWRTDVKPPGEAGPGILYDDDGRRRESIGTRIERIRRINQGKEAAAGP
jgi:hypothetical protein